MIRVTIDGRETTVPAGRTVLEAAREHGINIPTLCYHEAMAPYGACRLCVVEVEAGRGRQLVASCTYPCSDGLVVYANSEAVRRSRQMVVELLLATARNIPLVRQLAQELGVEAPRFTLPEDDCILCGLCVRACHEIVGVGAISVINRGIAKRVSPPFRVASDVCIRCGTCVLVCPTGAWTLAHVTSGALPAHEGGPEIEAVGCRICSLNGAVRFVDPRSLLGESEVAEQVAEARVMP